MLNRNIGSDIQTLYFGSDAADDDTAGVGIADIVLADNGVVIALHDVAIIRSREWVLYADCPFMVKVSIADLNIRKGAGTNTAKTGTYTGVGVFTIVQVKSGKGSDKGWGKLKSGVGWISLDYCQRV